MKHAAASFIILLSCGIRVATAGSGVVASNCATWVSDVMQARKRPAIEMLVEESISGTRRGRTEAELRSAAENAYRKYDEIRKDFTNMEDYVQRLISEHMAQSHDYSEFNQYRMTISTNGFLVVSSNRLGRFGDHYNIISATRTNLMIDTRTNHLFRVVTIDHDSKVVRRYIEPRIPAEYMSFLSYGCLTGSDAAQIDLMWRYLSGQRSNSVWDKVCASGDIATDVVTNGAGVRFKHDIIDTREAISIEISANKGKTLDVFAFDRDDGRVLMRKEARRSTGLERVECHDFESVSGSTTIYPQSILEQRFDEYGTQLVHRTISVQSLKAVSDEQLIADINAEIDRAASYEIVEVERR